MSEISKLQRHLAEGRIGRREFLRGATALGVSAAVATSMAGKAMAAPMKGGRFRFGIAHGSTTDTLDMSKNENGYMLALDYTIHNHVGEIDADGVLQPEAMESWEASDDAKQWVFHLKKGVEFHNGKTMTSEDVVATVNYHRDENTQSPAKSLLAQVTEIKADGPDTVVVNLEAGNADFPFIMSDYHIAINPVIDGKLDATSGIGIGPYIIKEWEPGVRAFCTRNPNYHKSDAAHFDEVELISIVDVAARTNALTTGEVDAIDRVDLKTVGLLGRKPGVRVEETVGYRHYTFPMRCDTAPFDNKDVRLALKYALNRQELVDKILLGHGVVGNDHPISPSLQFHNSEMPQRQYDLDKAKFHLKQAGLSNLKVQLSAADAAFAGAVDAAVLYQEHARPAGIEIEVVREPNDGYWSNVWMNKAWSACYWGGRPTEDWMFTTAYAADASWNDTFWKNDRFNELLIQARAELNTDTRRQMYYEMQQIVSDDGGLVLPMFANYVFAMSDKVGTGEKMAANWTLDGLKFADRWWFA
ncbi:ABC transporter substrate-binding protein [Limibacillus halophilus]